jgi:hypothetical protein
MAFTDIEKMPICEWVANYAILLVALAPLKRPFRNAELLREPRQLNSEFSEVRMSSQEFS